MFLSPLSGSVQTSQGVINLQKFNSIGTKEGLKDAGDDQVHVMYWFFFKEMSHGYVCKPVGLLLEVIFLKIF